MVVLVPVLDGTIPFMQIYYHSYTNTMIFLSTNLSWYFFFDIKEKQFCIRYQTCRNVNIWYLVNTGAEMDANRMNMINVTNTSSAYSVWIYFSECLGINMRKYGDIL